MMSSEGDIHLRGPGSTMSRAHEVPGSRGPRSMMSQVHEVPGPRCLGSTRSRVHEVPDPRCPGFTMSRVHEVPGLRGPRSTRSRVHEVPGSRGPKSKQEVVGHMQKSERVPGGHSAPNQNFRDTVQRWKNSCLRDAFVFPMHVPHDLLFGLGTSWTWAFVAMNV